MVGKRRLKQATLGVLKATRIAQGVPAGAIIEIRSEPPESNRMVDVVWKDQEVMMFVRDLLDRSEELLDNDDQPGEDKRISASG